MATSLNNGSDAEQWWTMMLHLWAEGKLLLHLIKTDIHVYFLLRINRNYASVNSTNGGRGGWGAWVQVHSGRTSEICKS